MNSLLNKLIILLLVCSFNLYAESYRIDISNKTKLENQNLKTKYLGCYRDELDRDLNGYSFNTSKMSTDLCVQTCTEKGFKYAATQYSSHCFCGNEFGKYGLTKNCDMKCSGKSSEICGGSYANSVYKLSSIKSISKRLKKSLSEISLSYRKSLLEDN